MAGESTAVRDRTRPRGRQKELRPQLRLGRRSGERTGAPAEWPSPCDGRIETQRHLRAETSISDQTPRADALAPLQSSAPHTRGLSSVDGPPSAAATGPLPPTAASKPASRRKGSGQDHGHEPAGETSVSAENATPAATGAVDDGIPFPEIRPQVLFVEDEPSFSTAVRFLLERHGLDLTAARGSDRALELLRTSVFDVALIDWKLDGSPLDGLELLKETRRKYHGLPLAFITAFDDEEIQTKATQAGADAYLTKGDDEALCKTLKSLVRRSRSQEEWTVLARMLDELGVALSDVDESTRKALARMCLCLRDSPRMSDLANAVRLAPKQFRRQFKDDLTVQPKRFLMRLQVQTAILLLRDSRLNNSQIAARSGFRDLDAMYYAFRAVTGRRVRDFRECS